MRRVAGLAALFAALLLSACAAPLPPGPSVVALPGQAKSFDNFQQDDSVCRQFASAQIGMRRLAPVPLCRRAMT